MIRQFSAMAALAVTASLSACGDKRAAPPPPPATPPATNPVPYECPPGMPSYKCQQLQERDNAPR